MKPSEAKLPGSSVVYLTDISRVETDDLCGMRYWMNRLEGGQGVSLQNDIIRQLIDSQIHGDLRTLAMTIDLSPLTIQDNINEVLSHLTAKDKEDIPKMELLYRRLGWFAAFALYMEGPIRTEYETIPIEPAIVLDKDPLWVVAYPDRLLKRRIGGDIVYREYVPMGAGLTQNKWLQSWHYNIRLHAGLAAAIEMASDPTLAPQTAQVMGLNMGFHSVLNNRLVHPYTYGYRNLITHEWKTSDPDRVSSAWEIAPVWCFPGGVVAWVRLCGEETAKGQFKFSSNVTLNKNILDSWAARRVHREREISLNKAASAENKYIRSVFFPKITNQCYPANADTCPYLHSCWGTSTKLDDRYVPNVPQETGGIAS